MPSRDGDLSWQDKGACIGHDPEIFVGDERKPNVTKKAERICNTCPVKFECLDWALRIKDESGFLGGTTGTYRETNRRQLLLFVQQVKERRLVLRRATLGSLKVPTTIKDSVVE